MMRRLLGSIRRMLHRDGDHHTAEELRREAWDSFRATVFPEAYGDVWGTESRSLVDTRFFRQDYADQYGRAMDGVELGSHLLSSKGPWLRLSPQMEVFAAGCKALFNPRRLRKATGLDLADYNTVIREMERKDYAAPFTTSDAGAMVPMEFLATIVEFATVQSPLLAKVWRIPMGAATLRVPRLSQVAGSYFGGIQLYHIGEGVEKPKTKPAIDRLEFTAKKLVAIIPLTDEVIPDTSINIVNYMTGLFVRAFQWQIEYEIINGLGTGGEMTGILTDSGINTVARQTSGTVVYDDVINLESALDENFLDLMWLSRRATLNVLRKEKDPFGQPVYHDGFVAFLGERMVPQMLGYPVHKTRNVPILGTRGDIILGDMGMYLWAVRQDMTVETSRVERFYTDETVLRFVMRQDGMPGVPVAFAALGNPTLGRRLLG